MEGIWYAVLRPSVVVFTLLLFSWTTELTYGSGNEFQTRLFEGIQHVYLLECTVKPPPVLFSVDILQLTPNLTKLAGLIFQTKECMTNRTFVSCVFHESPPGVVLSAVITDLEEGETRTYRCKANLHEREDNYNVSITRYIYTTTATTNPTTTTAGPNPALENESSGASTADAGLSFSPLVFVVVLVVLVILIIICAILLVLRLRDKKHKIHRSRDSADVISLRSGMGLGMGVSKISDKDCLSMGGFSTIPRDRHPSITSRGAPTCMAPDLPGGNRYIMQYQKPLPLTDGGVPCSEDRGYNSGSTSVHYQEPWGQVDSEVMSRLGTLKSNPRMCFVPGFDATSSDAKFCPENKLGSIEDNT